MDLFLEKGLDQIDNTAFQSVLQWIILMLLEN